MYKYYISALILISYIVVVQSAIQLIETTDGLISGKVLKTVYNDIEYYGFMGIPYAVPPLKELRFVAPKPVEPWEGELKTTTEKKACVQFNNNIKKGQSFGVYGMEDCLYLDIFTPGLDKQRAVIVFIYNEHMKESYNKTKDYAPDFFIEEDVVLVTISHRLSTFGFLSFEDEIMPGNSGLKDIVLGLKWVKKNIKRFGGDPDKITLMGSQGGAAAVDLLIHSTEKSLFKAAILQSGISWTSSYLQEDVKQRAYRLAEIIGIPSGSDGVLFRQLIEAPPADIVSKDLHASPKDYFKETQKSIVAFGPIVEKDPKGLILEYPEDTELKIDMPILMGLNSREGLDGAFQYLIEPRFIGFLNKDFPFLLPRRLKFRFDPTEDSFYDAIDEIKQFYFNGKNIKIKNIPEMITYMGDIFIGYATDYAARRYANASTASVYYYNFNYFSDLSWNKNFIINNSKTLDGTWGAATGDELCYLFKCPELKKEYLQHDETISKERVMQKKIVRMWTNFAKYNNPTPADDAVLQGLKWPAYNLETKEYLHIDDEIAVKRELNKERFEFWEKNLRKWEQQAENGVIKKSMNNKKDEL